MKRQLMNAVAGALTLSIALGAGGAASAAARTLPATRPAAAGYRLADDKQAASDRMRAKGKVRAGGSVRVAGQTGILAGATFTAAGAGRPSVHTLDAARVTLTGCVIRKQGRGAAVLAGSPSLVALNGCAITTDGGGHGIVADGPGSDARVANSTIRTAPGAHAALAAGGGRITLENVNVAGGGLRGGRLTVYGGTIAADGSPVLQSDGLITVHGATGSTAASTGAGSTAAGGQPAALIDGPHAIDAIDTDLTGPAGVLFTATASHATPGAATHDTAGIASYRMSGGSLTATAGAVFEVRGTTARVRVKGGAAITAGAGVLARVSDGGALTLTASGQGLRGDVITTSGGSAALALRHGSTLTGAIVNGALELDAGSTWYVTGDSVLTRLTGATRGIVSNGHAVGLADGTVLIPQNGNHLSL
jgi:hypothetical protein